MNFSDMLHRANLNSIEDYLIDGSESLIEPSTKKYLERLAEAKKKVTTFFKARYENLDEYDEIAGYFEEQADVFKSVFLGNWSDSGSENRFSTQRKNAGVVILEQPESV